MDEIKSRPSNNKYRQEYDRIFGVKEKSSSLREEKCIGCHWEALNSGCNVKYDEEQCRLNRKPKNK